MTPTEPTPSVLELRDASAGDAQAGDWPVVENINWFVNEGDYWVVSGLPGVGKSQLLATAAGLTRPLRGTLRLFGRDTFEMAQDEMEELRLRLGMVFSGEGRIFRQLTIAENVELPLAYHRDHEEAELATKVAELLDWTGVSEAANRLPGDVNWNLRQRATLARALALQPEVLFLDDPLRGLDRRQIHWWLEFLGKLNEGHPCCGGRRMTLVIVANDLSAWTGHASRFALINRGRWMFLGGRQDLPAQDEPLLRELLAAGA